jgi:hypothetical protein
VTEILGAVNVHKNADLIAYIAPLYLGGNLSVCDVTWGKGNWWKKFQPDNFVGHDKFTLDGADYTDLPESDDTYDVVCFDPPYVSKGGRATSGIVMFDTAYGLEHAPKTPAALLKYNCTGLDECIRVTKPGGLILMKSMNYVSSGRVVWATKSMVDYALADDAPHRVELVDEFVHVGKIRMQPKGRRQVHARRNYSYLHIFRKVK